MAFYGRICDFLEEKGRFEKGMKFFEKL